MFKTSNFARRYGLQEEHRVFEGRDYLPKGVRKKVALKLVGYFESLPMPFDTKRWMFAKVVAGSLPDSRGLSEWYEIIPDVLDDEDDDGVRSHLIEPLINCDWRRFYATVEDACANWKLRGYPLELDFAPEFNMTLGAHRIPWVLQSGWVIPAADFEFADELKHAREVAHPPTTDRVRDPHDLMRYALDALYGKHGGPDLESANMHAWAAWKAAAGAASGFGPRDRRTFQFVEANHPRIAKSMEAWRDLAEQGRHPEDGQPQTYEETRYIVMLCVNTVRSLCPTCNTEKAI